MKIQSQAPSNIALIKYMGKSQVEGNRPTNASLSFTLNHLITEIVATESSEDSVHPIGDSKYPLLLSENGRRRFLKFFSFLKEEFSVRGNFSLSSGNNFPSDCGLASSASSFAALTKLAYAISLSQGGPERSVEELAKVSQKGSGSSCRSFFSPFSVWEDEGAKAIDLGIENLLHSVLILEDRKKSVSSSQAHVQVLTSSLFEGRVERARKRLDELVKSLRSLNWHLSYQICWDEFWDMHVLFETSRPSFGYLNSASMAALGFLRSFWEKNGDGPLVTMDAGPNVHLLFRPGQDKVREEILAGLSKELPTLKVLNS